MTRIHILTRKSSSFSGNISLHCGRGIVMNHFPSKGITYKFIYLFNFNEFLFYINSNFPISVVVMNV